MEQNLYFAEGTTTTTEVRSIYGVSMEYLWSRQLAIIKKCRTMGILLTDGKFPKRIGDYVLYRLDDQVVIRSISGFTSKGMKHAAKYELSRQNASEFGRVSALCKQVRLALYGILPQYNNLAVVNSFTKKMRAVMTHDTHNVRGHRHLATALADESGREFLRGYELNPDTVFSYDYHLYKTHLHLAFAIGAKVIGFRMHRLAFNFENAEKQLVSGDWHLYYSSSLATGVDLELPLAKGEGVLFILLEVACFAEADGSYLELEKGKSVRIVWVGI